MQTRSETGGRGSSATAAWYAVAILTIANICGLVDRQILSLMVEPMKRDFALSDFQFGLLNGLAFVIFYSVLALPIGRLVDRTSRRTVISAGIAIWSGFAVLSGAANTFVQIFAARIGIGAGEATIGPSAVSIIGDAFPRSRRTFAMSVYSMSIFVGSGMAYYISALLVEYTATSGTTTLPIVGTIFEWQKVFIYAGLAGLPIAVLAMLMKEPARTGPASDVLPLSELVAYYHQHKRTILLLSFGFAASAAVNWGIGAWLATFFVRTHKWESYDAGKYMGILTMTFGVFGVLLGGVVADKWRAKGRTDAPLRVGILAAIGMIFTAGLLPLVPSSKLAAALLIPTNIVAAMPWGAASAAIADVLPSRLRGQGSAMYQFLTNLLGAVFGIIAIGYLTDYVFRDPLALRYSLAITTIVGMVVTVVLLTLALPSYRKTIAEVQS